MGKIILEFPISIAMKFASRNTTDSDVGSLLVTGFFAPFNTDFGSETSDVFVILKISPKFDLGTRFLTYNFTNYGDGWCNVTPGAAPDY